MEYRFERKLLMCNYLLFLDVLRILKDCLMSLLHILLFYCLKAMHIRVLIYY